METYVFTLREGIIDGHVQAGTGYVWVGDMLQRREKTLQGFVKMVEPPNIGHIWDLPFRKVFWRLKMIGSGH